MTGAVQTASPTAVGSGDMEANEVASAEEGVDVAVTFSTSKLKKHVETPEMPCHVVARLVLLAIVSGALFGIDLGSIGAALAGMSADLHLGTVHQEAVVSGVKGGAIAGCLIGGAWMAAYGRRNTLAIAAVPFLLGPVLVGFASSFWEALIGRTIMGFGVGVASVAAPCYLSEVAPPARRGRLVSYYELALAAGYAVAAVFNYFIEMSGDCPGGCWRYQSAVLPFMSALPLILAVAMLPESPLWLLSQAGGDARRLSFALQAIRRLGSRDAKERLRSLATGPAALAARAPGVCDSSQDTGSGQDGGTSSEDGADGGSSASGWCGRLLLHERKRAPGRGGSGATAAAAAAPRSGGGPAWPESADFLVQAWDRKHEAAGSPLLLPLEVAAQRAPELAAPAPTLSAGRVLLRTFSDVAAVILGVQGVPSGAARGLALAVVAATLNQLCASTSIMMYAQHLLKDVGVGSRETQDLMAIAVAFTKILGVVIGLVIINVVGRRPLLGWGASVAAAALVAVCLGAVYRSPEVLLIGMCWYILVYVATWGNGYWVVVTEITAAAGPQYISACQAFATAVMFAAGWLSSFTFVTISEAGGSWSIMLYACISILMAIFAWVLLPETRGYTLEECASILRGEAVQTAPRIERWGAAHGHA